MLIRSMSGLYKFCPKRRKTTVNALGEKNGVGTERIIMRNKVYSAMKEAKWPFNLQLFAEGDDAGAGDGNGSGSGAGAGGGTGEEGGASGGEGKPVTFDDFLKGDGNQAEFDRRVQKAIDTAVTNAQQKWQTLADDKLSEAEKLAKMTKEEKAEYKAKKLEKEIADLKRANALSDMSKTARKMLSEEEITISDELLSHLVSDDAEDTKTAVESFAKLFKDSVQNAVKDALKGNPPKAGTGGKGTVTKEQILAIKDRAERQRMITQHMNLFQ